MDTPEEELAGDVHADLPGGNDEAQASPPQVSGTEAGLEDPTGLTVPAEPPAVHDGSGGDRPNPDPTAVAVIGSWAGTAAGLPPSAGPFAGAVPAAPDDRPSGPPPETGDPGFHVEPATPHAAPEQSPGEASQRMPVDAELKSANGQLVPSDDPDAAAPGSPPEGTNVEVAVSGEAPEETGAADADQEPTKVPSEDEHAEERAAQAVSGLVRDLSSSDAPAGAGPEGTGQGQDPAGAPFHVEPAAPAMHDPEGRELPASRDRASVPAPDGALATPDRPEAVASWPGGVGAAASPVDGHGAEEGPQPPGPASAPGTPAVAALGGEATEGRTVVQAGTDGFHVEPVVGPAQEIAAADPLLESAPGTPPVAAVGGEAARRERGPVVQAAADGFHGEPAAGQPAETVPSDPLLTDTGARRGSDAEAEEPVDLRNATFPAPGAAEAPPRRPARVLPRVMAVANQKGGVGKTTTAVNLGAALAELGYRTLVVDLDPQGNATTGLGINARTLGASVYDVLMRELPVEDAVEPTSVRNLFVVPATIDLAGAEIELVPAFSRELRLKRALEGVSDEFDFTLIDCPPSLGLLTVNALAAATEVVVPVQCEYYALEGLSALLRNVQLVQSNLNKALEISTIILTMYDARTKLAEQVANEVRLHFGDVVCRHMVPRTVRLSEAPSFGQPILVFDPTSRGAIAYRELAREVSGGTPQRVG